MGQMALAELYPICWYPLYIFARRRGHLPEDAHDVTQGFFLHLLEHPALSSVGRLKGKFRSLVLASFQNHLSDLVDHARRLKRARGKAPIPLGAEDAEEHYRREPVDFLSAERLRNRYTGLLGEEVSRAVSDPARIDEEFRSSLRRSAASERRLSP